MIKSPATLFYFGLCGNTCFLENSPLCSINTVKGGYSRVSPQEISRPLLPQSHKQSSPHVQWSRFPTSTFLIPPGLVHMGQTTEQPNLVSLQTPAPLVPFLLFNALWGQAAHAPVHTDKYSWSWSGSLDPKAILLLALAVDLPCAFQRIQLSICRVNQIGHHPNLVGPQYFILLLSE